MLKKADLEQVFQKEDLYKAQADAYHAQRQRELTEAFYSEGYEPDQSNFSFGTHKGEEQLKIFTDIDEIAIHNHKLNKLDEYIAKETYQGLKSDLYEIKNYTTRQIYEIKRIYGC